MSSDILLIHCLMFRTEQMLFWAVAENERFLLGCSGKSSILLFTRILMIHKYMMFQKVSHV